MLKDMAEASKDVGTKFERNLGLDFDEDEFGFLFFSGRAST